MFLSEIYIYLCSTLDFVHIYLFKVTFVSAGLWEALGEIWEALGELWDALGELWDVFFSQLRRLMGHESSGPIQILSRLRRSAFY